MDTRLKIKQRVKSEDTVQGPAENETSAAEATASSPAPVSVKVERTEEAVSLPSVTLERCDASKKSKKKNLVPVIILPTETSSCSANANSPKSEGSSKKKKGKAAKPAPENGKTLEEGTSKSEEIHTGKKGSEKTRKPKKDKRSAKGAPAQAESEKQGGKPTEAVPGPKARPLDLIRDEAFKLVEAVTRRCTLEKGVTKALSASMSTSVNALNGLVQELILRNGFLEGQLAAVRADMVRPSGKSAATVTVSRTAPRSSTSQAGQRAHTTYADAVKVVCKKVPPEAVKPPQHVVRIFPPKGTEQSSEATKRTVLSVVKPAKEKIRVRSVRLIHSGGIAVETERKEDLQAFTGSKGLKDKGLSVSLPTKRNPSLIVYDVPKTMAREEVASNLWKQNLADMTQKEVASNLKVSYQAGPKGREATNWVIDVSPQVRQRLTSGTARVYLGWSACRVQDYVTVTRCFKCQKFGHTAKRCKYKEDVCGHCAEKGHTFATCSKKSGQPVCSNCKERGKPYGHKSRDKLCASYQVALQQVVARTNYG